MKDYKKILENVVGIINTTEKSDIGFANICNYISEHCPELTDSEDERIRKELIAHFKTNSVSESWSGLNVKKVIAWLEKQGEKFIPENIDEAALQYVDTCAVDGEVTHDNVTEPYWNNHSMMKAYKAGWLKQGEQKPIIIIPKFREGDEIKTANEKSLTITKIDEKGYWSEDLFICNFNEECLWELVP
jgi:hypothetical protein